MTNKITVSQKRRRSAHISWTITAARMAEASDLQPMGACQSTSIQCPTPIKLAGFSRAGRQTAKLVVTTGHGRGGTMRPRLSASRSYNRRFDRRYLLGAKVRVFCRSGMRTDGSILMAHMMALTARDRCVMHSIGAGQYARQAALKRAGSCKGRRSTATDPRAFMDTRRPREIVTIGAAQFPRW